MKHLALVIAVTVLLAAVGGCSSIKPGGKGPSHYTNDLNSKEDPLRPENY